MTFKKIDKQLKRVIIFSLIAFLILCPFFCMAYYIGDILDFDYVIKIQQEASSECIVGMIYGETNTEYLKITNINNYNPKIITVGASRSMQFKDFFFESSFYNGGKSSKEFDTYSNFILNIDSSSYPDIILLDLNQFNFNHRLTEKYYSIEKIDYSILDIFSLYGNNPIQKISKMFVLLGDTCRHGGIGSYGINCDGFMKDGSYYYGDYYADPNLPIKEIQRQLVLIDGGYGPYYYSNSLNNESVECLDRFLNLCSEKDIYVVGFIPPFASSTLGKMAEYGDNYAYINQIYPSVKPLFDKYNYEVYDYTDLRAFGVDDSYFVDAHHGGEVSYLAMLMDMVDNGSILQEHTDIEKLQNIYKNRYSNLTVYPLIF